MAQANYMVEGLGQFEDAEQARMAEMLRDMQAAEQQNNASAAEIGLSGSGDGEDAMEPETTGDYDEDTGLTTYGGGLRDTTRPGSGASLPSGLSGSAATTPSFAATAPAASPAAAPTMPMEPEPAAGGDPSVMAPPASGGDFSSSLRAFAGGQGQGGGLIGASGGLLGGGLSAQGAGGIQEDPSSLLLTLMQLMGQGQ